MTSQTVLLTILGTVVIAMTLIAATVAAKTIGNSTVAGLAALGIMLVGVTFVLLDSFIVIDHNNRNGRAAYIRLEAKNEPDKPFCECHSTWTDKHDGKITRTCNPPNCDH